jgi:hypothetical protein
MRHLGMERVRSIFARLRPGGRAFPRPTGAGQANRSRLVFRRAVVVGAAAIRPCAKAIDAALRAVRVIGTAGLTDPADRRRGRSGESADQGRRGDRQKKHLFMHSGLLSSRGSPLPGPPIDLVCAGGGSETERSPERRARARGSPPAWGRIASGCRDSPRASGPSVGA